MGILSFAKSHVSILGNGFHLGLEVTSRDTLLQSCERFFFFSCLFAISRVAPAAHGGSQARGRI